ncbi:unnamed protein product [Lathyrus sativus]|nr:unnamed protein product [Lathyrus sativus]
MVLSDRSARSKATYAW